MTLHETVEQRLELYKIALSDYENKSEETWTGFCNYFLGTHMIFVYDNESFKSKLPELYMQNPGNDKSSYWFDFGQEPRIKCLEKAIELCEEKLKKQKS